MASTDHSFLQIHEYALHGVIYRVCRPVADIHLVRCLDRANDFLDESLLHSRHLTEQAHFFGVRDTHIGVRVGGCAVRNDERNQVSWVNKRGGINEGVLHVGKY